MNLTDELYEKGKNSTQICTIINNDYVLVSKTMPVDDRKLPWYLDNMKKAKERGINLSTVVDYRLIEDDKRTYSRGTCYTPGVFLEERAQGSSLEDRTTSLNSTDNYNFTNIAIEYVKKVETYIEEIERRAQAAQTTYDKLYSDFMDLMKCELTIDPKPLNFFFHPEKGFTIIDVIPYEDNKYVEEDIKYYPNYFIWAIYCYGLPNLYVDYNSISVLPSDLYDRLNRAMQIINAKIVSTLRRMGIKEEKIEDTIDKERYRMTVNAKKVPMEEITDYIMAEFQRIQQQRMMNRTSDSEKRVTIGL